MDNGRRSREHGTHERLFSCGTGKVSDVARGTCISSGDDHLPEELHIVRGKKTREIGAGFDTLSNILEYALRHTPYNVP